MEFGRVVTREIGLRAGDEMAARRWVGTDRVALTPDTEPFGDRMATGPVRTLSFVQGDRQSRTGRRAWWLDPQPSQCWA